jgi:hypothetical protein
MTTINCSSNCRHQLDGICTLENAVSNSLSANADCVFFEEKKPSFKQAQYRQSGP